MLCTSFFGGKKAGKKLVRKLCIKHFKINSETDCQANIMVLFLVGLGLGDETDITMKGLTAVKSCKKIFLETYTAILNIPKYHKNIILLTYL